MRVAPARMVLDSEEAQVETVWAELWIAQLATWLVPDELAAGDLVQVLPDRLANGLGGSRPVSGLRA